MRRIDTLHFISLVGFVLCLSTFAHARTKAPGSSWPGFKIQNQSAPFKTSWGRGLSPTEAVKEALKFHEMASNPTERAVARLMSGLGYYRQGRYTRASRHLKQALAGPILNRQLASFFYGESLFHGAQYDQALVVFKRVAKDKSSLWHLRSQARRADCLRALGSFTSASKAYQVLRSRYPDYPFQTAIRVAIAESKALAGDLHDAVRWLDDLVGTYPNDPLVDTARRLLAGYTAQGVAPINHTPAQMLERGTDLRLRKYFEPALSVLQTVLADERSTSVERWKAQYQIARTLYRLGRYQEAITSFEHLIKEAPTVRMKRWALRWKSNALADQGRTDEAAQDLLLSMGSPKVLPAKLIHRLAWLYFEAARYEESLEYFNRLAKLGGSWELKSRFFRAWHLYRLGRYGDALRAFKSLQSRRRKPSVQVGYWTARTLVKMGEIDAAVATYAGVIESAPTDYYAVQATARLDELKQPLLQDPDDQMHPSVALETTLPCQGEPDDGDCREEQWNDVLSTGSSDGVATLRVMVERWGGAFPALRDAYELAIIGEDYWASQQLRRVTDELRSFRRASRSKRRKWAYVHQPLVYMRAGKRIGEWGRQLGQKGSVSDRTRTRFLASRKGSGFWSLLRRAYLGLGDVHYARRHLNRKKSLGRPSGVDNPIWRQRFPRAFEALVKKESKAHGLKTDLVWAIMTVESAYNAKAVSRVGARGLMQVMPRTGALVADRMGMRNFGVSMLVEPEIAIAQGGWYFAQLSRKFNGQWPLAIASYNAGPHRVARWLSSKGHLAMDEFIEEMRYDEVRAYTRRVLSYISLYGSIYRGDRNIRVGQIIDPDWQDNINF